MSENQSSPTEIDVEKQLKRPMKITLNWDRVKYFGKNFLGMPTLIKLLWKNQWNLDDAMTEARTIPCDQNRFIRNTVSLLTALGAHYPWSINLYAAVRDADLLLCKILLTDMPTLMSTDEFNLHKYKALRDAIQKGNISSIRLLLQAGADPNYIINAYLGESSPLIVLASSDLNEKLSVDIFNLLVSHGAVINDKNVQKILNVTIGYGNDLLTFKILESYGEISAPKEDTISPLLHSLKRPWNNAISIKMIETGVGHYKSDDKYEEALIAAAKLYNGHEVFPHCLKMNANINVRDSGGNTALHIAAQRGHIANMEYLLKKGADYKIKNKSGKLPIELANSLNGSKTVELLKQHGAKMPKRSKTMSSDGRTYVSKYNLRPKNPVNYAYQSNRRHARCESPQESSSDVPRHVARPSN